MDGSRQRAELSQQQLDEGGLALAILAHEGDASVLPCTSDRHIALERWRMGTSPCSSCL